MTDDERRAWIRTLMVLAVVAAVRWAWSQRIGEDAGRGPGVARDVAAAVDTVRELRSEEERRSRPLAPGETIDPNLADDVELDRLPGVGPATAAAIIATRAEQPFRSADDLLAVRGIGPATLEKLRPHVSIPPGAPRPVRPRVERVPTSRSAESSGRPATPGFAGSSPVDINVADASLLESLPGIGPTLAARIMRDRVESGRYTRVDDLLRVSGIGPATLDRIRPLAVVR